MQVIVPSLCIYDEKAGLGRNRQPHLVGHLKAEAADEFDLIQKDVDLAFKRPAQGRRKLSDQRYILFHDGALMPRQRHGQQAFAKPLPPPQPQTKRRDAETYEDDKYPHTGLLRRAVHRGKRKLVGGGKHAHRRCRL
ncbi:hypothetical protein GALL_528090 [mine drainage metagenome]|uniref:Uncharacterized protein n=1 Tax=mine drainage metagenome TaxID=410659 RepID=A0A1J5PCT2_9ZZZZ